MYNDYDVVTTMNEVNAQVRIGNGAEKLSIMAHMISEAMHAELHEIRLNARRGTVISSVQCDYI